MFGELVVSFSVFKNVFGFVILFFKDVLDL